MNKKLILLFSGLAISSLFTGCYINKQNQFLPSPTLPLEQEVESNIKISMLGDILIHNTLYEAAKKGDTYDFSSQFEDISYKTKNADLTIGNLEVPLAGKELGYSNYPSFNCPEQLADSSRDVLGIDVFTTANNHSLDKGYRGLSNTLDFLDNKNISHTGTYRNKSESEEILIKDINGLKVAILAYTYGTNGNPIPKNKPYCVNLIDEKRIISDSKKSKDLGADLVIASIHWGVEYEQKPSSDQKSLAKKIFENSDVDIIMGTHPHVVQPIEQITVKKDNKLKTGTVLYSLGNFVSGQKKDYTDTGIIVELDVKINKSEPTQNPVSSIKYTPVFVDKNPNKKNKYRVVNINKAIYDYENDLDPFITEIEYNKMVEYKNHYKDLLLTSESIQES